MRLSSDPAGFVRLPLRATSLYPLATRTPLLAILLRASRRRASRTRTGRHAVGRALALIGAAVIAVAAAEPAPMPPRFEICYQLGCSRHAGVELTLAEVRAIAALFEGTGADPEQERQRIAAAIAAIERIAGQHTPTHLDRGRNPGDEPIPPPVPGDPAWPPPPMRAPHAPVEGQLDCIDEATNTTAYLQWMAAAGWIRWHRVREWAFRAPDFFGQHWSAQVEELASGRRYVVDSWPGANGEPPEVLPFEVWRRGGTGRLQNVRR